MNDLPSGTVTFLFTDIEGSTKLAQEYPEAMPALLARHHEILHQSIEDQNGYVFQIVGDSFAAAFHSASEALSAALAAQQLLQNETWTPAPVKVRMGLHTGTAQLNDASAPNNLPTQLTSFIGREKEIAEVKQVLEQHRLVTLTGSGGAGKTRLSLEVGAACLEQFKHGVWFVELAALTDPALIISAVLSAFGVHDKENDIHSLANHIGKQSLFLILDNCEHLVEDCARLVDRLLNSCPNLRILASSREAFSLAGEQPYHVRSLPFPDPKHLPTLHEMAKCESVQLFIERVKTYIPSFSLTEKNAAFIAQICCRLDGIPLALELAAARAKVMSVEQMASRLGDMFNLLTSGSRTALPRQQTLRALIEWSYDLLSESEKLLFRRLAAFSGGWSLEAAEAVCSGEGGASVLEDLARLVDKSLVSKEEVDGEARFHMLETIRQYAEFKMFASEEVEDVKNRHRDWFMQLAETAEPKLRTGEQLIWLNRLELEHDNLRAAMKWSMEQKHVEQALRIPSALVYFWEIHGHDEEGRNWFDQAFTLEAQSPERKYPFAWAAAVNGYCRISWYLPDIEKFKSHMEEALKIFRKQEDSFRTGHLLYYLAVLPYRAGDLESSLSTYQEGLKAYQSINNSWGMGECVHCMAHIVEQQGKIEESHALYNQSLEALKPIGDRWSLFHPMGDTAVIALNKGELNTAKMILEESIQTFEELKNRGWTSISINRLTEVLYEQGDYENARKVNQCNLEVMRETNDLNQMSWSIELKGRMELAEGNLSSAYQLLDEALAISEKNNNQFSVGFLKTALGLIDCYEGNYARGKEEIEIGIDKVRREDAYTAPRLFTCRSHALWLEKDLPGAARSYRDTIQELHNNYYFIRIPECLEGLGKIAALQSNLERAARLFGAAEALRQKMGTPIPPIQRREYEDCVSALRTSTDDTEFKRIWDEGRAMSREEAIQYAAAEN